MNLLKKGVRNHLTIAFPVVSVGEMELLLGQLPLLMPEFAAAQDEAGTVHYSRFMAVGVKRLLFLADTDGDLDEVVGTLAVLAGQVFHAILAHVENPPPTPVASNSGEFVKWAKHHNRSPLSAYSAFEDKSVQEIKACASAAGFSNTADMMAMRYDEWKISFKTIKGNLFTGSPETTQAPIVTNLRQDPWERYQDESMNYGKWWGDKLWTMVPATVIVAQFLETFKEYPPSQKSGGLTVSQFLEAVQNGAAAGGK